MLTAICSVLLIFFFNAVSCASHCSTFTTCGKCISYASERCVWCSQDSITESRCQPESYQLGLKNKWCLPKYITNPQHNVTIKINKDFGTESKGHIVQFKPQEVFVKVRPGVPINITVSYHPAKDYPLDVYYLMDNSYTMEDNQKDLYEQGKEIYDALRELTNNVRLGAGGFIEKPLYPYYDSVGSNKISYSFKNHLSLTTDINEFINVIKHTRFGANYDDPESGFDALMQSMMCLNDIGWRNDSRRIIVFCTDSPYHSAGDGKMIGIMKPNDMKCHLNNNTYSMATQLDYPSVSQINKVATDGQFIIIFAIKLSLHKEVDLDYTKLAKQIYGAQYTELKTKSNIVKIIEKAYNESVRAGKLRYDAPPWIDITIDQDCRPNSKRNCALSAFDAKLKINVTFTLKNCSHDISRINISPVGLTDTLSVLVQSDCECECETISSDASPSCSNAGFIQCGICKCYNDSYGNQCQCNSKHGISSEDDLKKCKANLDDMNVCSGHGYCSCGKCTCYGGFSGNHCEFNDNNCLRANNLLCAGRGKCQFGECHCYESWTGEDCNCPIDDQDCRAPYSQEVCSGNGICKCGTCICNKLKDKNETYKGIFCDSCNGCPAKYCKEIEDYAYCNFINNKEVCDKMPLYQNSTDTDVSFVNRTEFDSYGGPLVTQCKKELEDGGWILFKYFHDQKSHQLHIIIQKEKELPPVANLWVAAGSAIAIIVVIGLLTVILWKILVDMHDKKEYKKFEKESRAAGFDVSCTNPFYEEPVVSFTNPTYCQRATNQ